MDLDEKKNIHAHVVLSDHLKGNAKTVITNLFEGPEEFSF